MQAVCLGNLAANSRVPLLVKPAARFGLPPFDWRIGMTAKATAGSMRPWIGVASTFWTALIALPVFCPILQCDLSILPIDVSPVFPQRRKQPRHLFGRPAHENLRQKPARFPGHARDLTATRSTVFNQSDKRVPLTLTWSEAISDRLYEPWQGSLPASLQVTQATPRSLQSGQNLASTRHKLCRNLCRALAFVSIFPRNWILVRFPHRPFNSARFA